MGTKKKGRTEVYPFWELSDIKAMIDGFSQDKKWKWRLAFNIGLLMGRRVGDTLAMHWYDFYEENGRRKHHLEICEEKTDKTTYVLIPDLIWKEIELYIEKTGINPAANDYRDEIFPYRGNANRQGRDRRDEAYRKAFKDVSKKVGIRYPVCTHSTRKTFGYYGIKLHPNDPANIDILQKFFNHSDRATTLRYIGLTQEKQDNYSKDWGKVMEDVIAGKQIILENSPVITLKTQDLREILKEAYLLGENRNSGKITDIDAMNMLIEKTEKMRIT